MMRIAIIGGGIGGLASALFLARRGHRVTIVERDSDGPPIDPDACFSSWHRQGVGQANHTHVFMPRASKILSEEAPDVLRLLGDMGAVTAPMMPDPQAPFAINCRRLPFEAVLRRVTEAEPNVAIQAGDRVTDLLHESGPVPHVRGLRTASGQEIDCDLVVDCGGRASQVAQRLTAIGARPPLESVQKTGFFYLTRWYRLRDGEQPPEMVGTPGCETGYSHFIVMLADNRTFSITMCLSDADPLRHAPRDATVFDRIVAALPLTAPWIERGIGTSGPEPFANVHDRKRSLVDGEGPIVGGYVLVGDSALCTNPNLGRGVSLALAHAQHLASTVTAVREDPSAYVAAFQKWTDENLGIWFDLQVLIDAHYLRRLAAFFAQEPEDALPAAPYPARAMCALGIAAMQDPRLAILFRKVTSVLMTLDEALGEPGVEEAIKPYLANPGSFFPPQEFPRSRFEQLVVG